MRRCGGTSLIEVLTMLGPVLLILGVALALLARSGRQDGWNDDRLAALDAMLIANERIQADLAGGQAGAIEVTEDGIEIEAVVRGGRTERVTWRRAAGGQLERSGKALRAAPISGAGFRSRGPIVELDLAASTTTLHATAFLAERAARDLHPTWR
jgi:hypothetical protein